MEAKLYGDTLGATVIEIPFNEAVDSIISKGWVDSVNFDKKPYYVSLSHCETEVERLMPQCLNTKKVKDVDISRQLYITVALIWINKTKATSLHFEFLKSVFEK